MKNKVRPIYFELQGYLSQAPSREIGSIYQERMWQQHNKVIDELEEITGKKYDRYRLSPTKLNDRLMITPQEYRTILGGIISRLYGEYFMEELSPIK